MTHPLRALRSLMTPRRTPPRPSWGVAVFAREPAALVLTHLAWHLQAGAREIHLYLDDPADPVAPAAAALPGVRVTLCDAEFWAGLGKSRPVWNNQRQDLAVTHAYRRCGVDWLLHLDADEFLFQTAPLDTELAALPATTGALRVPVRERAYTRTAPTDLFEGVFRLPRTGPGRDHRLLAPNRDLAPGGLSGHALGKSLTRRGLDVTIRPHFPRRADGADVASQRAQGSVLLHFDGLTPRNWLMKLLRYDALMARHPARPLSPHRQAQIAQLAALRDDPAAMLAFHDRIKLCPDPDLWAREGLIARVDFDPLPALRAHLTRLPDLSVAGFDAATRQAEPALMRGL
jgi:hypothetical protein